MTTQKTLRPILDANSGVLMGFELRAMLTVSIGGKLVHLAAGTRITRAISGGHHYQIGCYAGHGITSGPHSGYMAAFAYPYEGRNS